MDSSIFDRIVCGIDGTDESREAVSQVARLAPGSGRVDPVQRLEHGGIDRHGMVAGNCRARRRFRRRSSPRRSAPPGNCCPQSLAVQTVVVEGPPGPMMLTELGRHQATLVALGSHDHRRLMGIVLGSVTTQLLHESPCPVLLARAPQERPVSRERSRWRPTAPPSPCARSTSPPRSPSRLGTPFEAVVATGGEPNVDLDDGAGGASCRSRPSTSAFARIPIRPSRRSPGSRPICW